MEEFIGEKIEVEKAEDSPQPVRFIWRKKIYEVAEVLDEHVDTGYGNLPPGSQNWRTRRHRRYFAVKDYQGDVYKIYLDYSNRKKPSWWLAEKQSQKNINDIKS
ncbi:MAG: hypothetical protein JW837_17185 [Sedimentisphaerales bacterium]|nr:hypothetical protein [Sedimentisphaerales bacterium]